jgi:uncharacterized cofD-like protein
MATEAGKNAPAPPSPVAASSDEVPTVRPAAHPEDGRRGVRRTALLNLQWLYPGMRVKRFLALIPFGMALAFVGVVVLVQLQALNFLDWLARTLGDNLRVKLDMPAVYVPFGLALLVLGLGAVFGGLVGVTRSIISAVAPEHISELPEVVRRKRALAQGARIVVVGGGTGLSTMLRGLKQYSSNLTAVVTMTDDGGSSGLLQKQMVGGMLPPGDIRNCLVALADAEPLMQQLFQYRFATRDAGDGLSGHNFGNLLIAAMADITGDFERAVEETSRVLAIRGRVLPSTVESVVLVGEMEDGREVTGETNIAHDAAPINKIKLCPAAPRPLPEVLEAIREADIILMGPGSVFTSVVPNLLVTEIAEAVAGNKRALKAYVCNVMTQPGETAGYAASDHVRAIEAHAGRRVFDYVLVNTARPSDEMLARYTRSGAQFVEPDYDAVAAMGYKAVKGSFISETAVVRHDPDKLARAVLRLWNDRPFFGG